jgi:hypothetical protein
MIQQQVMSVHQGRCPICSGSGPVDVHTSYWVWSVVFFTRWGNQLNICCRPCGVKKQLGGLALSLVVGWWGIPWGFIMTPVQAVRNAAGIFSGPEPLKPSEALEKVLRMNIGLQAARSTRPKT